MKGGRIAWSIVGLLSVCAAARAGPVLIGGSYAGIIYDVDPTTGAASNSRDTGLQNLSGLAWSTNAILYGLEVIPFVGPTLVTIDPQTGAPTLIGAPGAAGAVVDIAFDPTTGTLFGATAEPGAGGGDLFKIDTGSGVASRVGSIPTTLGMAVDAQGNVFLLGGTVLYNIDKQTGQILGTVPLSPNLVGLVGAAVAPDGRFFVTGSLPGETDSLYVLDQKTGVLDAVGPTGVADRITSLTSVPEPFTGVLVGVAALWSIFRARSNRRKLFSIPIVHADLPTKAKRDAPIPIRPLALAGLIVALWVPVAARSQDEPGSGGPSAVEVGPIIGPDPSYARVLHGDFVVGGVGTRVYAGSPQTTPRVIKISGIPAGSTIERAYANWSYLTKGSPDWSANSSLQTIQINGTVVSAQFISGEIPDLCWYFAPLPVPPDHTGAFHADVTSIVVATGGNGTYTVGDATDKSNAIGEGISLLVIYSNPAEPLRLVSVYWGLTLAAFQGPPLAQAVLTFKTDLSQPVPYQVGPLHFFLNGLDGQCFIGSPPYPEQGTKCNCKASDDLTINALPVSGLAGAAHYPNVFRGDLGPGARGFNFYDHIEGDASRFVSPGAIQLEADYARDGVYFDDCVGFTIAAVSFVHPDWCLETVTAGGPHDCNCNAIPDICEIRDNPSLDIDKNYLLDQCDLDCQPNNAPDGKDITPFDAAFFSTQADPQVGGSQRAVAAMGKTASGQEVKLDVDQDGVTDLVVVTDTLNAVKILIGDGFFFASPTTITFPGTSSPYDVAAGNFNADSGIDLAVVHRAAPGKVSIVLNNGGISPNWNGFAVPTTITLESTTDSPESIRTADLDGDGDLDLAIANRFSRNVSVLYNNGSGGFTRVNASPFAAAGAALSNVQARELAIADVDGDGRPDLVVADGEVDAVSVRLNAGGIGAQLNFTAPQDFPAVCLGSTGATLSLSLADMDRDGDLDVLFLTNGNANEAVGMLVNRGRQGSSWLGFEEARVFRAFAPHRFSLLTGDMNMDGFPDALVVDKTSPGQVFVMLNDRTGELRAPLSFTMGSLPERAAIGFFNDDPKPDLAVASASGTSVSYLLNATPDPESLDYDRNGVPDECHPPVIAWNTDPLSPDRTTRSLRFKVTATPGQSAIRVELVELQHPCPRNAAATVALPTQTVPQNFSRFDTDSNGVCSGATSSPNYNGHPCDPSKAPSNADCLCNTPVCPSNDATHNGVCLGNPGAPLVACTATGETVPPNASGQGGCARWVGKPATFLEAQEVPTLGNYRAARLQCTPFYYDWVTETAGKVCAGPLTPQSRNGEPCDVITNPCTAPATCIDKKITVVGAEILPSSTYSVQAYGASCKGSEGSCANVSAPVTMFTRRHGDVASVYTPPDVGQPGSTDVTEMLRALNKLGPLRKAGAKITPNPPEENIDIDVGDLGRVVDSVSGYAYPPVQSGPCPCPSAVTCGAVACGCDASSGDCAQCHVCAGGTNHGAVCTPTGGQCQGGTCGVAATQCVKTCRGGPNDGQPCRNNSHCYYGRVCLTGNIGAPCTHNYDCDVQGDCVWPPGAPTPQCTTKECDGGVNIDLPCDSAADCPNSTCVGDTCYTFSECFVQGSCPSPGICDKECRDGVNKGLPCGSWADCNTCTGGYNHGARCIDNTGCPGGGTCSDYSCEVVTNTGFCRDGCGRCKPPASSPQSPPPKGGSGGSGSGSEN